MTRIPYWDIYRYNFMKSGIFYSIGINIQMLSKLNFFGHSTKINLKEVVRIGLREIVKGSFDNFIIMLYKT